MKFISKAVLTALFCAPWPCFAQLPPDFLQPPQPGRPASADPIRPVFPPIPEPEIARALASDPVFPNTTPNAMAAEEVAQGWRLLFDGRRLIGLKGVQRADPLASGWKIDGGELVLTKEIRAMGRVTGGDLITTEPYWDFDFRFEWKASVSGDSGVRYLTNEVFGRTPSGLEYQIVDDMHHSVGLKGGALRRSGALDSVLPVGDNARLRSADPLNRSEVPWNEGRIVVRGTHVEHWLNGDKVLEFELGSHLRRLGEKNGLKLPVTFGAKARTRLCILDQGTMIAFRNLKIRPLIPMAVVVPENGAPPVQAR